MDDPTHQGRPAKRKRDSSCSRSSPTQAAQPDLNSGAVEVRQPSAQLIELPANDKKNAPTVGSFSPLVRELQRLDDDDPLLAAQAARLVGLYRRLWESYVVKRADNQRLEKDNWHLEQSSQQLLDENRQLGQQRAENEALILYFKEAFQKFREGIIEILEGEKDVEPELSVPSQAGPVVSENPANKS